MPRKRQHATAPRLYKQPGCSTWHCRFSVEGRQYRRSTGEHEENQAWSAAYDIRSAVIREIAAPFDAASSSPERAFQDHWAYLSNSGRSKETLLNYGRYALRYINKLGTRPLGSLARPDIIRWRDWLLGERKLSRDGKTKRKQTLSSKTVSEHLNWLATVLKHYGLPNATAGVERPRRSHADRVRQQQYYTVAEVRKLQKHCHEEFRNALTFLLYTGCRVGELRGIKHTPRHIQKDICLVYVTGKGQRTRAISLRNSPAWGALLDEIDRRQVPESTDEGGAQPVFPSKRMWEYRHLERVCGAAKIPFRSPHAIRHTVVTHALQRMGKTGEQVSKIVGHASVGTTSAIYDHAMAEQPLDIEY